MHDPGCVCAETRVEGVYHEEPARVMTYRDALTRLRVGAGTPEDCAGRARKAMKEW
ncbi:hypothetical protein EDD40_4157 [Saccharothrix texasensis]|uniref:DUF5753 domain-containing protein n=1 Tax=Saccharothrix texasensis TaxID=103734 RepID=A0A3N1H8F3_9PSEU|nr:hypothetical protein EDD40_4157 [Saccharothrix texasensis]